MELYDPFSAQVHEDPYPIYKLLRDEHPVYHNRERDIWAISRYDDVQAAGRDWERLSNDAGVDLDELPDLVGPGGFINMDPPRHDELRDVVRRRFAPRAIGELEPQIREHAVELIEELGSEGRVDAAQQLAWRLPVRVVSGLLGLPREDRPDLQRWIMSLEVRHPDQREMPDEAVDAAGHLRVYFATLLDTPARTAEDGVFRDVLAAVADGRCSREEAVGMCFLLFLAATDTTASLVSNSLLLLSRHPDVRARLVAQPDLLPVAIEEILRYESPVQGLARITTCDVALHGETIPAGARVFLLYGAANRDERRFEQPDRLWIDRPPKRHLAFGEGIHFCLGAPLARLEGRVALEEFLARFPDYAVDGPVERLHSHTTRGLMRLPVHC